MINSILILVSLLGFIVILFIMYQRARLKTVTVATEDYDSIDKVLEAVKIEMLDIIKDDYTLGLSELEFNASYKRKARINESLRNCVYGIDNAKVIVIELIRGFIKKNVPTDKIAELLGLAEGMEPSDHVKFEIIMYRYKKKRVDNVALGKNALAEWILKYKFSEERTATGASREKDMAYYVTVEDLHMSYEEEDIKLTDDEKVDILAILIYQLYKGFGIVDTLREMDINGFNMGTSGNIMPNVNKFKNNAMSATSSVWLYFQGKYIHLRFMNFGTEDELRRIVQLLIRWGNPGPLTAKRGYLVTSMFDKSRVLALRPPASEYWAVFVRKFTLSDVSPEGLIIKKWTKRGDLPVRLIEFLMRGQITCAVTGRQGSGKTTMMSSIIRFIDNRYTLRILEMAPELYLRELYPTRNILSVQETNTVSASELQDALKKSDAAVSIVGEVATDVIAARMIQMGQVASIFTIFSHHANTARDLVFSLRNSLSNAGGFSNMITAERQVTDVVKIDVHLDYTPDGKRYIERISEIIPLEEKTPYPDYDPENPEASMANITREFYERTTDRVSFVTHDILKYDLKTHTYYIADRFSPQLEAKIRKNLGAELCIDFDKFMLTEWGVRKNLELGEFDDIAEAMIRYYEEGVLTKEEPKDNTFDEDYDTVVTSIDDFITKANETADTGLSIAEGEVNPEENDTQEVDDALLYFDFFDGEVNI